MTAKWRESDPETRATLDPIIDDLKGDLAQVRDRIKGLEEKVTKRRGFMRGLRGRSKLTEMSDKRDWLRLWVSKVWVDGAAGHRYPHQRLTMEWNFGP